MSYPLFAAAVLTIGVGIAHSYLGERYVITRLLRRGDLPHLFGSDWFTRRTLRFAWHLTTVAWSGLAVLMLLIGDTIGDSPPSIAPLAADEGSLARDAGLVIASMFGVSAVITAVASRFRHLAWPVFGAIAVLTWVAV